MPRDAAQRSPEQIKAEIGATLVRLSQLEAEHAEAVQQRRQAVIKAFDDGARRAQIVAAYGITYSALACILNKAGRTERQRQALGLSPEAEAHYRKLTRRGVASRSARSIALALAGDCRGEHLGAE